MLRPFPIALESARTWALICAVSLAGACDRRNTGGPVYPPAEAYERDPAFAGEWLGEVGDVPGVLTLGELSPGTFFGSFKADAGRPEYVLLLEQTMVDSAAGGIVPSNRVKFSWQDGLGGRGNGWLLINREDTALTGSFGYEKAADGLGGWTFMRVDAG